MGKWDDKTNLVCFEARSLFPDGVEPGLQIEGLPEGAATEGMPEDVVYTVTEVYPQHVVLDGNHPLAGIALRLSMKVESVREATEAEVGQGSLGTGFFKLEALDGLPPDTTLH